MPDKSPSKNHNQSTFRFEKAQSDLLHEDYIISPANSYAAHIVQSWPKWEGNIALIYGPPKSGKTHLAHIWQQHVHAAKLTSNELYRLSASEIIAQHKHILIENIETIHEETALFHIFN